MKRLLLLCLISTASAQTYYDKTTIAPTGPTNTVLGNKTSATAAPTYMAVGTCSTSSSALIWTTNTGFGCNTGINAATLLTGTWAAPGTIGSGTPSTGAFTTLSATGQITSTLATGTAPLVIASTTNVANLNASSLSGATFAAPGAIGGGTPSTGAFTTISATGQITSTLANGTAPFAVTSSTNVANLNASTLSGATFAAPGPIGSTTPSTGAFTTITGTTIAGTNITSVPTAIATTDAGNVGFTLISGAVPFIFNTCTLNATGAISSCATMPLTYANAYMFFNAAKLAAAGNGSAAGFYYVQMSSTTAGQACLTGGLFTLYSTGSPTIPASCSAPASGVAVGANTIPNTIMQGPAATVIAHSMGKNGSLECDTALSQTSSANARTMTFKFGASNITMAPTTAVTHSDIIKVVNAGSEAAQGQNIMGNNATTLQFFTTAVTRATVDTGSNVSISWNETMNTSTEFSVLERYACKVWPN